MFRRGRPVPIPFRPLQVGASVGMGTLAIFNISWYEFQNYVQVWGPLLLMGLLVYIVWRTFKLMPRTKPQEITPRSKSAVGWPDVAGIDETKDELREVVEFLSDPKRFKRLGATVPKGILLHGPPGTGKTLLAKAVAHESGATFFSQSASSFIEMFAGLGAARIRRLFKEARENARRPSCSSTSSMRSAPSAARTSRASATRRSTSSWWRWTASTPATT